MCGGRSWLRLHSCPADYAAVPAADIPVFLREQLLRLPQSLGVMVIERLSAWIAVVCSEYSQAADKGNFYATPPLYVGGQAVVFHGAACPSRPLSGVRYVYSPRSDSGRGGPLHLQPLQWPLQATLYATFCKPCGRPSPLDAEVLTLGGVCMPRVFCLHRCSMPAVFTGGVASWSRVQAGTLRLIPGVPVDAVDWRGSCYHSARGLMVPTTRFLESFGHIDHPPP